MFKITEKRTIICRNGQALLLFLQNKWWKLMVYFHICEKTQQQGGRGHWTVYFTGTQNFITNLLY